MKKILLFITAFCILTFSFATVAPAKGKLPPLKAGEIFIPVGKTGTKISLLDLSQIKLIEVEQLTGHKMKFTDRIAFIAAQKKLRKTIDTDGTIRNRQINKFFNRYYSGETGFHAGGFALGFFLTIIGVLIAYLINDDYKKNRVKWAWIGSSVILGILTILVTIASQTV